MEHIINESQLKTNFLVKDMIEKNLEHLTTEIKEKYSSDKNKDVKSKWKNNKINQFVGDSINFTLIAFIHS